MKVDVTENYRRYRQFAPGRCDKKSFRTMTVNHDTKMVVCCPKGKFKRGRCKVGLRVQSKLKRRKRR